MHFIRPWKEFDIPDDADSGVLKDEEVVLFYGENKKQKHGLGGLLIGTVKTSGYLSL